MRDMFHVVFGWRGEPLERRVLVAATDTWRGIRNGDHAAPRGGEAQAGEQRAAVVLAGAPPTLDDKPAVLERPGAHRRAPPAPNGSRQSRRVVPDPVQFGDRPRDRQRELSARPEAGMLRQRAMHGDPDSTLKAVVFHETPGILDRTIRILTLGLDHL